MNFENRKFRDWKFEILEYQDGDGIYHNFNLFTKKFKSISQIFFNGASSLRSTLLDSLTKIKYPEI